MLDTVNEELLKSIKHNLNITRIPSNSEWPVVTYVEDATRSETDVFIKDSIGGDKSQMRKAVLIPKLTTSVMNWIYRSTKNFTSGKLYIVLVEREFFTDTFVKGDYLEITADLKARIFVSDQPITVVL